MERVSKRSLSREQQEILGTQESYCPSANIPQALPKGQGWAWVRSVFLEREGKGRNVELRQERLAKIISMTYFFFSFPCILAALFGMQDGSPTRDQTRASAVKALNPNH